MTEAMSEIHHAIVQCMTTTLSELKRANTSVSWALLTVPLSIETSAPS